MSDTGREQGELHTVVVNDEEQYSIWPAGRPLPPGWSAADQPRPLAECLERINELWTDMRPLSLRRKSSAPQSQLGEKS